LPALQIGKNVFQETCPFEGQSCQPGNGFGYIIYCSSNDNLLSLVFLVSCNFVGLVLTDKLDRRDSRHFCYSLLLGSGPFSLFTLFILFIGSFNTSFFFWSLRYRLECSNSEENKENIAYPFDNFFPNIPDEFPFFLSASVTGRPHLGHVVAEVETLVLQSGHLNIAISCFLPNIRYFFLRGSTKRIFPSIITERIRNF
jgi:hypothetical protein